MGVVSGVLVTSPLYVYPSMPLKSPIELDCLGIHSLMFLALTLVGVKVVMVVVSNGVHRVAVEGCGGDFNVNAGWSGSSEWMQNMKVVDGYEGSRKWWSDH
ncbi:hypothetical protein Nepgr_003209 [Nepenthes gracilis]|uniref:K+ potassium transporter integral membrane domain-containing protein n=1 Tax=Nepenthes gracilis TaxID=150966 RepID=A0AAD3RZ23_NEPGR|nr:hypothetical protein Nepgr_003209 [Nepenthes gracilis]